MSGQTGLRRSDDHIVDGHRLIEHLIDRLQADDVSYEVDAPVDAAGEWWIDLSFEGFSTNVAWHPDRGFGVFTSADNGYGSRPDEVYREPELAAKRLRQLAKRLPGDCSAMKLGEVRKLFDQPQTLLAERLRKDQAFISRLERQNDALMSTIKDYVEALGGEVRLIVRFEGFEAPIDLPGTSLEADARRHNENRSKVPNRSGRT